MRLLIPFATAAVPIEAPPAWVLPAEVPEIAVPTGPVRPSVQYLLVDDQLKLHPEVEHYADLAYRIVSPEGLDELSRVEITYQPEYQELVVHEVSVLREGAWHDRLEGAELSIIQPEAGLWQHMVDGSRMLVAVLPDVRVGDVLRYRYTLTGDNPVFGGDHGSGHDLGWGVPAARRGVRLLFDELDPPLVRLHGAEALPVAGRGELRWMLEDLPAVYDEELRPPDVDPFPWLQLSTWADWGAVVDWALPLYALDGHDPVVAELAAELAAEHPEPDDYARAALSWVQDEVRYWGAEAGIGSHQPRPPATVVQRRWGDCKDKSLLFVALLRERGIDAWPALVNATLRSGVARWAPSATAFDHVVAALELDGELVFVDPTQGLQGGSIRDTWLPRYGHALLVREGETALQPVRPGPEGGLELVRRYRLDERPELHQLATWSGGWADAQRATYSDVEPDSLSERIVAGGSEAFEVRDDLAENLLVAESVRPIAGYTWDAATAHDWFGSDALVLTEALPLAGSPRALPLGLQLGYEASERLELVADDLAAFPRPELELDTPWFHFVVTSQETDGMLVVQHDLTVRADRVEPEDLDAYLGAAEQVHDHAVYWAERPRTVVERMGAWAQHVQALLALLLALALGYGLGRRGRSAASR